MTQIDQRVLNEIAKINDQHIDMLIQVFSGDDGGFFVTGGGIRLGASDVQSLVEAVGNIIRAVYSKCGKKSSENFHKPMDN